MENVRSKIFEKNISHIFYDNGYESILNYTLKVPGEDDITLKFRFFESNNGSKGFDFYSNNLETLNELAAIDDPVEFRKSHSGIELEDVISFKDELVDNVVEIMNQEVKEIMDEAGIDSSRRGLYDSTLTADILSGKINKYQFETHDSPDVSRGEKTWREYKEVDGKSSEILIQGGNEIKQKEKEILNSVDLSKFHDDNKDTSYSREQKKEKETLNDIDYSSLDLD